MTFLLRNISFPPCKTIFLQCKMTFLSRNLTFLSCKFIFPVCKIAILECMLLILECKMNLHLCKYTFRLCKNIIPLCNILSIPFRKQIHPTDLFVGIIIYTNKNCFNDLHFPAFLFPYFFKSSNCIFMKQSVRKRRL